MTQPMNKGRWMRVLALLAATVMAALVPARAAAQDPDSARATLRQHGLCPAELVQISTTFGDRYRGRCVAEDTRLVMVGASGEQAILYTAVDSIWVRGPATRPATITGAWVGAGFGGAVGSLFIMMFCESLSCRSDYIQYGLGGAAIGAFTGGVLGNQLGRRARVWIRLYPR
jgi:hypothetical protein